MFRIIVDRGRIEKALTRDEHYPVFIIVDKYGHTTDAHEVQITGPSKLVFSGLHGERVINASVWLETESPIILDGEGEHGTSRVAYNGTL